VNFEYEKIPDDPVSFAQWLSQQPENIQRAAQAFPLGHPVQLNERMMWVVGYSVDGEVVAMPKNPTALTDEEFQAATHDCVLLDPDELIRSSPRH